MEPPSIENALQNLRSPVTGVGKFLLRRWIVPKARDAVGQREWGKVSIVVGWGWILVLHKDMEPPSTGNALQNLRSQVTGVGKFLLRRWIVPKARDAVGQREWGKVSKVVGGGVESLSCTKTWSHHLLRKPYRTSDPQWLVLESSSYVDGLFPKLEML